MDFISDLKAVFQDSLFPDDIDVDSRVLVVGPTLIEVKSCPTVEPLVEHRIPLDDNSCRLTTIDKPLDDSEHSIPRDEKYSLEWAGKVADLLHKAGTRTDLITVNNGKSPTIQEILLDMDFNGSCITITDTDYTQPLSTFYKGFHHTKRITANRRIKERFLSGFEVFNAIQQMVETKTYALIVILDFCHGMYTEEMMQQILTLGASEKIPILTDCFEYLGHVSESSEYKTDIRFTLSDSRSLLHLDREIVLYERREKYFDIGEASADETILTTIAYSLGIGIPFNKLLSVVPLNTAYLNLNTFMKFNPVELLKNFGRVMYSRRDLVQLKKLLTHTNSKVAITTGCFDIFHAGHAAMLEEAKALSDVLVVALNSDKSTKQLKGVCRPICTLIQRLQILLALKSVDFIVIFEELRPDWIIDVLNPDIFVKGCEYTVERLRNSFPQVKYFHIAQPKHDIHTSSIADKCKK